MIITDTHIGIILGGCISLVSTLSGALLNHWLELSRAARTRRNLLADEDRKKIQAKDEEEAKARSEFYIELLELLKPFTYDAAVVCLERLLLISKRLSSLTEEEGEFCFHSLNPDVITRIRNKQEPELLTEIQGRARRALNDGDIVNQKPNLRTRLPTRKRPTPL